MKRYLSGILFAILISLSSFSFAQSSTVDCQAVGNTAGAISQLRRDGVLMVDIEKDFTSPEFLQLTPDQQELIRALVKWVYFMDIKIEPGEHFVGMTEVCMQFGGDMNALSTAIRKYLSSQAI